MGGAGSIPLLYVLVDVQRSQRGFYIGDFKPDKFTSVVMTQLSQITKHHISLHCDCGHGSMVSVEELLKQQPPETTVQQVAGKARCTKCGRKGHLDFRLHWKCG